MSCMIVVDYQVTWISRLRSFHLVLSLAEVLPGHFCGPLHIVFHGLLLAEIPNWEGLWSKLDHFWPLNVWVSLRGLPYPLPRAAVAITKAVRSKFFFTWTIYSSFLFIMSVLPLLKIDSTCSDCHSWYGWKYENACEMPYSDCTIERASGSMFCACDGTKYWTSWIWNYLPRKALTISRGKWLWCRFKTRLHLFLIPKFRKSPISSYHAWGDYLASAEQSSRGRRVYCFQCIKCERSHCE